MILSLTSSLAALAVFVSMTIPHAPALAQSPLEDKPATTQPDDAETDDRFTEEEANAATEKERDTWTRHAEAVAERVGLNEDETEQLAELYVDVRIDHVLVEQMIQEEWHQRMAEQLRNGAGNAIFDRSELLNQRLQMQAIKRKQFAEKLVEAFGRERAEELYPPLGLLDKQADAMLHVLFGFELENEEAQRKAIETIEIYFTERATLPQRARQEKKRRSELLRHATEKFQAAMSRLLDEEDLDTFLKEARMRPR